MSAPDGPHLAFPFRIGTDGRLATVASLDDHIREEIIQLVLTSPGERAFLPDFGGGARRLVFEPLGGRRPSSQGGQGSGDTTEAMAKAMLSQSLSQYLGHRVAVEELDVTAVESTLTVDLRYRVAGTEDSRRLRFERAGG
jgi:uncharacterized protein